MKYKTFKKHLDAIAFFDKQFYNFDWDGLKEKEIQVNCKAIFMIKRLKRNDSVVVDFTRCTVNSITTYRKYDPMVYNIVNGNYTILD